MADGDEIHARCEAIEAGYEFMLAYAGQGLAADAAAGPSSTVRHHLERVDQALGGLGDAFRAFVQSARLEHPTRYEAFLQVLDRDARDAQAAVQLALAQPAISSQLVDNLNGSMHLRALLTDLFLIDEITKTHGR